jgi:hypothetical protein
MAERPIGFWLKLVDRLIDERFAAIIEEHGVTRRQWQLLGVIASSEATAEQLDAAIAPFLQEGAVETSADHLAELVESDWVSISDGEYELTPRGTLAYSKLSEVVAGLRRTVADGIPEPDYETTLASLERMARNLGYTD